MTLYLSLYWSVFWSVVIDGEMWSVNLWTGATSDDFTAQGNDLVPDKLNILFATGASAAAV